MRKVFPGGNTSVGFYSFYHYIVPTDARRIIIIKGGPGVGKSTFMRYIGEALQSQGQETEFHCCSSDNGSYDGVVFPRGQVALIDGTSPHVVDPKNPGAVDEILHLGDYWDEEGMRQNREQILRLNKLVGQYFQLAYNYLAQAGLLNQERESYLQSSNAVDLVSLDRRTLRLLQEVFPGEGSHSGERHLFASAITPQGPVNHLETIFGSLSRRIIITGQPGTGKATIIERIYRQALLLGYRVEAFHCSLNPGRIEHLYLPDLDTGIITSCDPHIYQPHPGDTVINTGSYIKSRSLNGVTGDLQEAEKRFHSALERAVEFIARAKAAHDEMESYYIPNMDFEAINHKREETLVRVKKYLQEIQ